MPGQVLNTGTFRFTGVVRSGLPIQLQGQRVECRSHHRRSVQGGDVYRLSADPVEGGHDVVGGRFGLDP
ncbi:hypothetical protein ACFO9E_03280, partial [Streptomyces maoxianensis]